MTQKKGLRIHVIPHSHVDIEWYWIRPDSVAFALRAISSALKIMAKDAGYCFSQDQAALWEPVLAGLSKPERVLLDSKIEEGALEVVGGMYVQPEVAEPHGECLIRQILYGKRWLRRELGVEVTTAWNIDTFGQCTQLPQILSKSGYKSFVFSRGVQPEKRNTMPSEFLYESPDSSTILTHWMSAHYCGGPDNLEHVLRTVVEHSTTRAVMVPWGCDISYPTEDVGAIRELVSRAARKIGIRVEWVGVSTPRSYFEDVLSEKPELDRYTDDFSPPLQPDLRGTYDNRTELKKANRAAEAGVISAENLATTGWLLGGPRPHLDELWTGLLYNHFHDIIGGSHYDGVYKGAMARMREIRLKSSEVSRRSVLNLAGAHAGSESLIVANTLGYRRTEVANVEDAYAVMDAEGNPLPARRRIVDVNAPAFVEFVADDLPAFGFRTYRTTGLDELTSPKRVRTTTIENEYITVSIDQTSGAVSRLLHKPTGHNFLGRPGNQLVAVREENPDLEGALSLTSEKWDLEDYPPPRIRAFTDRVGSWVEAEGRFRDCRRVQRILLYNGLPRVDFETGLLDCRGGDTNFEVRFPLALDWEDAQLWCETPYSVTRKPIGEHICAQTFVDAMDLRFGTALLNAGTPGYWARQGSLDLVLMRTFHSYSGYSRGRKALGLVGDDDDSRCVLAREHGDHWFRYSLYPHTGPWNKSRVVEQAHSYNFRPICVTGTRPARESQSPLRCTSQNFEVVCLKPSGGNLLLRGYETQGQAGRIELELSCSASEVWAADLLERPVNQLTTDQGRVSFWCNPHEIVTLLVKMNRGL